MKEFKTLVIDDERLAREELKSILREFTETTSQLKPIQIIMTDMVFGEFTGVTSQLKQPIYIMMTNISLGTRRIH